MPARTPAPFETGSLLVCDPPTVCFRGILAYEVGCAAVTGNRAGWLGGRVTPTSDVCAEQKVP